MIYSKKEHIHRNFAAQNPGFFARFRIEVFCYGLGHLNNRTLIMLFLQFM